MHRASRAVKQAAPPHPGYRRQTLGRSRAYWESRADQIAPEVGAYVREVLDSDDVLSMVRTVQSMVTHLEKFPVERAVAACTRARHYGSYQYTTIKNILRRGLDLVPATPKPTSTVLVAPRFARTIDEIFHRNEVSGPVLDVLRTLLGDFQERDAVLFRVPTMASSPVSGAKHRG